MTTLTLLLGVLLLVLLAFVWPIRTRKELPVDEKGEAIAVYRQEVAHLERQLARGFIDSSTQAALLQALDKKSAVALRQIEQQPLAYRRSLWIPLIVTLSLLTATAGFFYGYQQRGEAQWTAFRQQHADEIIAGLFDAAVVDDYLATHTAAENSAFCFAMQQQLLADYDTDAQALGNLARCHLWSGQTSLAAEAIARGLDNHPQHRGLNYAAAELDFAKNGRLSPDALARLLQVLQADPQHVKTLYLLTLDSYQNNRSAQAGFFFKQLQQATVNDPAAQTEIRQAFAELTQAEQNAPTLQLTVRLSPALAAELATQGAGEKVIFVVVKTPDGELFNASRHRLPAPHDTVNIRVSDQQAGIMQRQPMTGKNTVQVTARLSQSGEPLASSGDWTSSAVTLTLPQTAPELLLIDRPIP